MDPIKPVDPTSAEAVTATADKLGAGAEAAAPDAVVGTTVTVVTATAPPDEGTAPRDTEEPALRAEDVHMRPPDHLPESVTPAAENVGLIFERS